MSVFCELKQESVKDSGRFHWDLSGYRQPDELFDSHGDDSLDEEEEEEEDEDEQ